VTWLLDQEAQDREFSVGHLAAILAPE
jgi:hypothetical protein